MKQKDIALLNAEIAKHANGAAQFLYALLDDRSATQEQKADMADYLLDSAKKILRICLTQHVRERTQRYVSGKNLLSC